MHSNTDHSAGLLSDWHLGNGHGVFNKATCIDCAGLQLLTGNTVFTLMQAHGRIILCENLVDFENINATLCLLEAHARIVREM